MSKTIQIIDLVEAEKCVEDRLRRYWDMMKALDLEKEDRAFPSLSSSLGKGGGGGSGPGNPTLRSMLKATDPIRHLEIPDKEVARKYRYLGEDRIRPRIIPGCMIKDPVKWICLIEYLRDLFEGSKEGEILEEYFLSEKEISEVAGSTDLSKSQVQIGAAKVLGVGIGLAITGDLI